MRKSSRKILRPDSCCFCGLKKCFEATDHSFTPLSQLTSMVEKAKIPNPMISQLKQKATSFYAKLKQQIQASIDHDHKMLQQHLSRFFYCHIDQQLVNFADLCQVANGCYDKLPSKRAAKIIDALDASATSKPRWESACEIDQIKQQLEKQFDKRVVNKEFLRLKKLLPYANIVQKSIPELKLKKSTSELSNPQSVDQLVASNYVWKNVAIKNKTKTLELNNKNITDQELLKEMPKLASFTNVSELEIRNNRITTFSGRLIASNMAHIKPVDIRGNRVGDEGVLHIVKGIPHLKGLLISETNCTNQSLRAIVQGLTSLEKFLCEQNPVGGEVVAEVARMPNLRILSFLGCKLEPRLVEEVKKIFQPKGYLSI